MHNPTPSWLVFSLQVILAVCHIIVLKLIVTVLTSLYFQILWSNWLNFFSHLKKIWSMTKEKT